MDGTGDPALTGEGARGRGEGRGFVSLAIRAGAHERVLILGAVRGGGQRVFGERHHNAAPVGQRGGGGGGRDGALLAGFLLQQFLFSGAGSWELQQAGGLQDRDTAVPPAGVFAGGGGGGTGRGLGRLPALDPARLRLHGTVSLAVVVVRVFQLGEGAVI